MKRNSTDIFDSRKLSGDARQQRRYPELASERLPKILQICRRVDVDGNPDRYPGTI